jgi:thiol-disulfide isomerase/thioredoxin
MKKTYFLFLSLLTLGFFISCDKIEKDNFTDPDASFPWLGKKVLIEDFTGVKCPNCPDASNELKAIEELYPDKVIGIALHAGFFAKPGGVFETDFRTEGGEELAEFFSPESFPIGMVNRQGYPDNVLLNYTDWASNVNEQLLQTPTIELSISESDNRITIEARRLSDGNNNLKLVVCITEDKIIDKQYYYSDLIEDYEHNHVLRKIVNGTWGTNVDLSTSSKPFPFDYTLESDWVRSNCNVIAFVYDSSNKEILQVEKVHLTE